MGNDVQGLDVKAGRRPKTFGIQKPEVVSLICELHQRGVGYKLAAILLGYHRGWIRQMYRDFGLTPLPHDNREREQRLDDIPDYILFRCETIREANMRYQGTVMTMDNAA